VLGVASRGGARETSRGRSGRQAWPVLRTAGFDSFSSRTAWRYADAAVDVVTFQSFSASIADAVGRSRDALSSHA
jgi:hypothetical protein